MIIFYFLLFLLISVSFSFSFHNNLINISYKQYKNSNKLLYSNEISNLIQNEIIESDKLNQSSFVDLTQSLPPFSSILQLESKDEQKKELKKILSAFQNNEKDVGSSQVQIINLHYSIQYLLLNHFNKEHKKDLHSRYGLIKKINKLKKLLNYYYTQDKVKTLALVKYLDIKFRPKSKLLTYLNRYNNFKNTKSKIGQKLLEKRLEKQKLLLNK